SNFFSRLTHSHPGRVVWLVFNVLVALLLMEIGVYKALEQTLALYSNVAIAWVGALVADLVINRPLGLRPQQMEFKRAHLYDINPVGVGAMTIATIVSISAFYGLFGPTPKALAPFVALIVAFVTAPLIAWATDGKYYIARKPKRSWQNLAAIQCCICEHSFEPEDMASCPAYAGPICSLCCSLDARCNDLCKPHARIQAQVAETLGKLLPTPIYARINSQVGHYIGVFAVSAGLVGLTLGMIYLQTSATVHVDNLQLSDVLWKVFFALTIIIGVVAWLFVLAQQSRRAAEAETRRQTALLIQEIDAHKRTDAELQRAKEVAESANLAKSRYVVGLSGSTFRVKILLSEVTHPTRIAPVDAPFFGYRGPRKTILITDDDPVHRDLLREVLAPLGFILLSAPDGPGCLALAQHCRPDLFLLDISMSGMDGWTVAETLRSTGHHQARILMVSASALEAHGTPLAQPFHDGYLMKPIDIPRLLELIRQLLKIEWQYETEQIAVPHWTPGSGSRPPVKHVEELI
ncbi:MAG TPA: response regulator, partial [Xanthobacteraceae bacterium]|nr:response regulator [Xanthobacteraceae bacterium]